MSISSVGGNGGLNPKPSEINSKKTVEKETTSEKPSICYLQIFQKKKGEYIEIYNDKKHDGHTIWLDEEGNVVREEKPRKIITHY